MKLSLWQFRNNIYWTPKETLQSSFLFLYKMWLNCLFASCKSCARCFWGQMPNLKPVQWREIFVARFERFTGTARYLSFRVSASGLYWPWSKQVCPKTFCASFFHHPESVYKVGRNTDQDVVKISCQKISAPRKSPEGWPLIFWHKVRPVALSFHLPLEYEVRSLYIKYIHSYCTRNNGLFMSHNYLDLQTGDLKLYMCLPVVLLYQAEYVAKT